MDAARLGSALPRGAFVADPGIVDRYARDVTGRFVGEPLGVARPANVDEVAAVLRVCDEHGIGVVPQGGNTGLVGGAIADAGRIVLSLERLTSVGEVDVASGSVVAEAGATLDAVQGAARSGGFELPIDFAARARATIGGMVATDAGGAFVLRHGTMRDRVAGLQVVLASGVVVDSLDGPRDAGGLDLVQLVPGSEGTLGVVTAARLSLIPAPAHRMAALIALGSLDDAVAVTSRLSPVPSVEAVDFFLRSGLELVTSHAGLPPPFRQPHAAFLVVSCASDGDPASELAALLDPAPEVEDVAVAGSPQQAAALWSYRELHNPAINAAGIPVKLDVGVSPRRVPELIESVDEWLARERPGATAYHYGHLGVGNVHVNVLGAAGDPEMEEAILRIVAGMGGSISAEHGIGRAKSRWLDLARTPDEIEAMRAVKAALDPNGILNPGVLLPG